MTITLPSPQTIVTRPAETKQIEELTIISMADYPQRKRVTVTLIELGTVIIWQDEAYDLIGQWTDSDVQSRLLEMYSS